MTFFSAWAQGVPQQLVCIKTTKLYTSSSDFIYMIRYNILMSFCSDRATSDRHRNTDWLGYSEGVLVPGGGRSDVPSHHPGHRWPQQPAVGVQHLKHHAGCSGHSPVFHLSDIRVFVQPFPEAERTHGLQVHHQQWVGRATPISMTWRSRSRSAILSEAFPSGSHNTILGRLRIQSPRQPTCCWVWHKNIYLRKTNEIGIFQSV